MMELLGDHTLRVVALGAAILGASSGVLGSFALLRRQSLLGDAISHAALPGIVLAFMLTGSKASLVLVAGAALAGWAAALAVTAVIRRSRVPLDSSLGLALSVFFGLGLVLLTVVQKQPRASQAGLDSFLFGQAAALLTGDLWVMGILGGGAILAVAALWKELSVLTFDREFGASLGLPMRRLDLVLTALLVLAIVIGLQTVGVVLMSAMIVAPAAAARQWTNRLGVMVVAAAGLGAVSGVLGAVASSIVPRLPTGPSIVLVLTGGVVVSLLVAPARGLLWRWVRLGRARRRPATRPALLHLYALSLQHGDPRHGHSTRVLQAMAGPEADVPGSLEQLAARGLAEEVAPGSWAATGAGCARARQILEREEEG